MEKLKLNKIKFSEMKDKRKKSLYEAMWKDTKLDFKLQKCWCARYNKYSDNSYAFAMENLDKKDIKKCDEHLNMISEHLKKTFGIESTLFEKKFKEACSGSGNEIKKITTLHSSSLCALLFFYNVTENNPLVINLNGNEVIFSQSIFEFQNEVIEGRKPSNIDVVLVGKYKNDNGRQVILFLESKFAEYYLDVGCKLEISSAYLDNDIAKKIYNSKTLEQIGINSGCNQYINSDGKSVFKLETSRSCYLAGIKQMISHYIGVTNFISDFEEQSKKIKIGLNKNETDIYLAEILFDAKIGSLKLSNDKNAFESYSELHETLCKALKEKFTNSNVCLVDKLLTYSDIANKTISGYEIENKILGYYFGNI